MLSNNDPTKWDSLTKLNVIEFLNICSFYKDKNRLIAARK